MSERALLAGIDAFYSLRWDVAMSIYDDLIAKYPTDPTGLFFARKSFSGAMLFDYSEPDFKNLLLRAVINSTVAEEASANPDNNPCTDSSVQFTVFVR